VQQKLLPPPTVEQNKMVFIKTAYKLEKVMLNDVLYIEGMRDYRKIFLLHKPPIMTLQTFTALAIEIPTHIICRVHKSYMVAVNKIDAIQKDQLTIQQQTIPISDTYKKAFFELVQGLRK
jgi:DNA-binding LytR/AlgR family response regulator